MEIPFSPPYIDQDVIDEVVDTLKSGWITTGPKVKSLEEEIVKLTEAKAVLCVNSWTSGAILVLKWFGVESGDEVIIPAYTYSATALAVLHCGATPVMVDVTDDFTIDVNKIKELITPKTKVIIPVDIAGWMCDYDAINDLVNDQEIKVLFQAKSDKQKSLGRILILSDAAHSIGATYKGLNAGSVTDITIFSFHAVKNITTAEGGAICLNLPDPFDNDEEYALMRFWTLNGQSKDAFTKSKAGGWRYDILFQGLKVNMPDLCAAVGLAQIRKYISMLLPERKRIYDSYSRLLENFEWAELPPADFEGCTSSYHIYPLRIKNINEAQRDEMIIEIANSDVSVNVHFIPLPMLTLFKNLGYNIDNYPNSYQIYTREISLPIYPELQDDQINYVVETIAKSYTKILNNNQIVAS